MLYNQQNICVKSSWRLADSVTAISGALPSPKATGVYRHTFITVRVVSDARNEQITKSARFELTTFFVGYIALQVVMIVCL